MLTLKTIQAALALKRPDFDPISAHAKMAPHRRPIQRDEKLDTAPRMAAVLVLLYHKEDTLHFVLTRRPDTLRNHAGQISFPGGSQDDGETMQTTALRETCEELGICGDSVEIIGALTDIYIPPSDFQVHPYVGLLREVPQWRRNEQEVAEIIETPLDVLLDDTLKNRDTAQFNGMTFEYHFYEIQGHRVWGATAIMLSELEWRLRTVMPSA